MKHGYPQMGMGMGFYGSYILIILLIILCVLVAILLRNKSNLTSFQMNLIDILKEKYASGNINVDSYIERKNIIEETQYLNPYTAVLLKRYAECKMETKSFLKVKNDIENNNFDSNTCERLAKGEINYNDLNNS